MCKVTIKKVVASKDPKSGAKDGKPWTLWVFECLVSVDGSGEEAVRTCKTFDEKVAQNIESFAAGKTAQVVFEAKKEGDAAPFSFMLIPEKKGGKGGGARQQAPGESNRQSALRYAVELERGRSVQSGYVPSSDEILEMAGKFLAWLEGRG